MTLSSVPDTLIRQAIALHQQGRLAEAEASYARALSVQEGPPDIIVNLALTQLGQRKLDAAVSTLERAVRVAPELAKAHYHLGSALAQLGRYDEAVVALRTATTLQPGHAEGFNNLGNALLLISRMDEAATAYSRAIALKPGFVMAHNNLGYAHLRAGREEQAAAELERAVAIAPDYAEAHNNLGRARHDLGDHPAAIAAFQTAIRIAPDYAEAHANLSSSLYDAGDPAAAELAAREALRFDATLPSAHNALGNAIRHLGRNLEAEAHYREAVRIDGDYAEGYKHLAMCLQEQGRLAEAFALFDRHAAMTVAVSQAVEGVNGAPKQSHDAEQAAWLAAHPLPESQASGARVAGHAVDPGNRVAAISDAWRTSPPQLAVVDGLLTPAALASLRDFCLRTDAWRQSFERGYLGAVPESGFTPPIVAQIAEELRAVYPAIIGDHPLMYFWGFKYDSALHGIRVHADFAAVNVNFWVTPDEANLDPERGGLVVYDVAAPLDWTFERYNAADAEIRALIAAEGGDAVTVPYRANRAVIFDSDLFHETDVSTFKPGYENRRINVTLLFGRREDVSSPGTA